MSFPPVDEQLEVIRRGVEKIVPAEELAPKLEQSRKANQPLRIKYGIDPTAADVHLGHTVPLRKMRQFQELGHQAVIIIGNYTAMVGDPSGRDETRARLTADQVEENAKFYLEQVGKVVDLDRAEIHRNGDWFAKMSFADVLELTGKVTVAQLLTRDDFAKRMESESAIYLHECLYPVMQGWDSVEIKADVELGGTEQLHAFMLARQLQKGESLPTQIGLMSPILVGVDGVRRMGKSLGNYIGISEPPYEMMKKFMQVPDDCLRQYFELLTDIPLDEVDRLLSGHPKEAKVKLAAAVIAQYHDAGAAGEAAERWQREIGRGGLPEDIPEVALSRDALENGGMRAAQLLKATGLCSSTSDARRAIQQGGAYLGEGKTPIEAYDQFIPATDGLLIRVGKKRLCRLRIE
ncbi:MAG: tyrosine--tRNA ligase [Planctomycetota bacterium]|nr:MAG: tyrosine--tRNA ligase [Planctomycetota bacterium]